MQPDPSADPKHLRYEKENHGKRFNKGGAAQSAQGYAILGRTIDKCRALVAGNIGEYHFDCPLDNMLFGFKAVNSTDFKAQIEEGASDQEMIELLNQSGDKKAPEEIKRWAEKVESSSLYDHPEKRDFFGEQVRKLGLDPEKTTTFDWLEVDDRASHAQKAA